MTAPKLPPRVVKAELSAVEVFDLHAALGFARRHAKQFPDPDPQLPESYAPLIENTMRTMKRLGLWDAEI